MENSKQAVSPANVSQNTGLQNSGQIGELNEAGVVLLLADGKIQSCNGAAEKILGFTLEQIQGHDSQDCMWQTIHEDGSPFPGETHPVSIALSSGQAVLGKIMGLYRPSGELVWLQIDAQPLFQVGDVTPWAAVATFRDITTQYSATATAIQSAPSVDPSAVAARRTILIVEDSAEDREMYRRYLGRNSQQRYQILEAETGEAALEICQRVPLDAVLLDYFLPDYEGLELLNAMQQIGCGAPVLLVTGQGSETLAVQIFKAGAEDYLIKGEMTAPDLQTAVTEAIQRTELRFQLQQAQGRERLVTQLSLQIRQSLDLSTTLNTTVTEVRRLLKTDRVIIFRFNQDGSGTVVSESVGAAWRPVLSEDFIDPCLTETYMRRYQQGRIFAVPDIYNAELNPCHVEMLAEFQVQANLVVPILSGNRLWGLLITHHCEAPRHWQTSEIDLLKQLSTQLGTAIQQSELYQQTQTELAERRRIEAELRDSELFTRKILESTYDCIKVLNLETQLLYMNPGGQIQLGICDFSHYAGCQWMEFWQGEARFAVEEAVATAKAGGTTKFEGFCPTVDGVPKWWDVQVSPILDAEGNVERILAVSHDITSRRDGELALREGRDRLHLLYDAVKALLSSTQPLTIIDTLYDSLKDLLSLDLYLNYVVEDDPLNAGGSRLRLASHGGILSEKVQNIQHLAFGQGICGATAQERYQILQSEVDIAENPKAAFIRDLGVTAYSSQPLISQGKLFGTLSFGSFRRTAFTDNETELLQALCDQIAIALERGNLIDSLQDQTEQLRQADRLKDEFLAVLSHELRNPLNPILGWSQLLKTGGLDADTMTMAVEAIERNANLQLQLIEDLLDISRIMRGKLVLDASPVCLATVISAALETVRLAANTKQIHIEVTISEQVQQVSGDPGRLQQVVWNLLSNAVKFSESGDRIDVRLTQAGRYVRVEVIDTGKGINSNFVPFMFEYFRQQDGSTTRKFGGLGLGLAIARQITELHGGTIWAESAGEGCGATFAFQIPGLEGVEALAKAGSDTLPSHLMLTNIRILVVDDDVDARGLLAFLLESKGALVTVASSGVEALQALEHSTPNLLLTDIGMPEMDGYALLRAIRIRGEQEQQIPAVAITAYAGEINEQKAIAAGFQSHISKPVDFKTLLSTIVELTDLSDVDVR
jgi:PAS domain S-box-containing protein